MTGNNVSKPRAVLNAQQAIEIFRISLAANACMLACPSAVRIAASFGICEKTVRDIWKGRTWSRETHHLDHARPVLMRKASGRPRGSKDSRPRNLSRGWKSGLVSGVRAPIPPSIGPCRLPATCITPIDVCMAIDPSQRFQNERLSHQRNVISDSVDYQLHEWIEGTSEPSALVDPFQVDWMAARESIKNEAA